MRPGEKSFETDSNNRMPTIERGGVCNRQRMEMVLVGPGLPMGKVRLRIAMGKPSAHQSLRCALGQVAQGKLNHRPGRNETESL